MKISLTNVAPANLPTDLLAVACAESASTGDQPGPEQNPLVDALDRSLGGALGRAIKAERFRGKAGQMLVFNTVARVPAARVALIGVGKRAGATLPVARAFAARAARLAQNGGAARLELAPAPALSGEPLTASLVEQLAAGLTLGLYRFDKYLSEDKRTPLVVEQAEIACDGTGQDELKAALARGQRLAAAVARARDLVNEPAGHLTPTRLAETAGALAARHQLEITVFGPDECRRRGMGLFLAVAQGSAEEPRFIHLAWKPPSPRKRIVLVGKGVTFDSGGLSLKPNDSMLDMKTDMAGAASVISVMGLIAEERLPIEVHALAACTENMPSGTSYKLGDVLRSKAGKTVEINNTDAEGRLTLADAISYGLELGPDAVFDFATLTGACMVALGPHTAGVMSNDDALVTAWLEAAKAAGEDMWRLPLTERLAEQLKSDIADMKNTGERWGGALTAGLFLKEFVGNVPWVHVDLAGPSTADKDTADVSKGGTGFAVLTIFEYLRRVGRG